MKGVYYIHCTKTDTFYIGSSVNIATRFLQHTNQLIAGKHTNKRLQRDFNKYGGTCFRYDTLAIVPDDMKRSELYKLEQVWIDSISPKYNVMPAIVKKKRYKPKPLTENTPRRRNKRSKGKQAKLYKNLYGR